MSANAHVRPQHLALCVCVCAVCLAAMVPMKAVRCGLLLLVRCVCFVPSKLFKKEEESRVYPHVTTQASGEVNDSAPSISLSLSPHQSAVRWPSVSFTQHHPQPQQPPSSRVSKDSLPRRARFHLPPLNRSSPRISGRLGLGGSMIHVTSREAGSMSLGRTTASASVPCTHESVDEFDEEECEGRAQELRFAEHSPPSLPVRPSPSSPLHVRINQPLSLDLLTFEEIL